MSSHPIQPLEIDAHGTLRFKANDIIRQLVDTGVISMNNIAMLDVSEDDRNQFAQLVGYSLSGYGSLSYANDLTYEAAYNMHHAGMTEQEARLKHLEDLVAKLKESMRGPVAELFGMHEDDIPT